MNFHVIWDNNVETGTDYNWEHPLKKCYDRDGNLPMFVFSSHDTYVSGHAAFINKRKIFVGWFMCCESKIRLFSAAKYVEVFQNQVYRPTKKVCRKMRMKNVISGDTAIGIEATC